MGGCTSSATPVSDPHPTDSLHGVTATGPAFFGLLRCTNSVYSAQLRLSTRLWYTFESLARCLFPNISECTTNNVRLWSGSLAVSFRSYRQVCNSPALSDILLSSCCMHKLAITAFTGASQGGIHADSAVAFKSHRSGWKDIWLLILVKGKFYMWLNVLITLIYTCEWDFFFKKTEHILIKVSRAIPQVMLRCFVVL